MLTYENFFPTLLQRVSSFAPIYDEHIKDNDELLSHVLMGDLARFSIELYRAGYKKGEKAGREKLGEILKILDEGIQSPDSNLQELISVSFLENLGQADEDYDSMRALLTPALLNEMKALESWRPGPPLS